MGGNAQPELQSWGRYRRVSQDAIEQHWRDAILPSGDAGRLLPYGQGRSYGDVAQNGGGTLICTRDLDRFIAFDRERGVVRVESGVRLDHLLALVAPDGWYLPVVPGTQFISIGGAIANDVHGKNHHREGTFGCHVLRFELLRSDGTRIDCSPSGNADWFAATVGGLGLTGLVTWAELALKRIPGTNVEAQTLPCRSLAEFASMCDASDGTHEYTVAWFDCFSYRDGRFRGLFMRANHAAGSPAPATPIGAVPFTPPVSFVRPSTMKAFNLGYFKAGMRQARTTVVVPLDRYLYPLDRVAGWNRLYGPRGFLQLQCAIPHSRAEAGIAELLDAIARSGQGSCLAVLKRFGARASPGVMSFPLPGITLALDFPFKGPATLRFFDTLHAIVLKHQGRMYAAKDACMTPAVFEAGYPHWRQMKPFLDPAFGSDFWRRVTAGLAA
ncbi:MAG: FAD-binding oxidoreductase [Burkholderiales bacterium]